MTWFKLNYETKNGRQLNNYRITGLSTDVKPTTYRDGSLLGENSRFFETDTFDLYFFDGVDTWVKGGEEL